MSETSIGTKVRDLREATGKSREQIAFTVGVSTSTITRLENESRLPNAYALKRIARELAVTLDDLVPESSPSPADPPVAGDGALPSTRTGTG